MKALTILTLAVCLAAQTASFDIATFKLCKEPINVSSDPVIHGRTVTAVAMTLRDLIVYAYGIRYDQVGGEAGPSHYDVMAKSEGEGVLTLAESRRMMLALLAERFRLRVHRETVEMPMLALVVGKGGPRMKVAAPDATGGCGTRGDGNGMSMTCTRGSMEQVARQLAGTSGKYVVDRTGLTDRYVFTMAWWPENRARPEGVETPSMAEAVGELGLRLVATKGEVEKVVIDGAEKAGEN